MQLIARTVVVEREQLVRRLQAERRIVKAHGLLVARVLIHAVFVDVVADVQPEVEVKPRRVVVCGEVAPAPVGACKDTVPQLVQRDTFTRRGCSEQKIAAQAAPIDAHCDESADLQVRGLSGCCTWE